MKESFLLHLIVFLIAAIACVPLAKRLGLGSVLGYLAAGIIIGPFSFGLIGYEGKDLMHVAEFGVVMMLFLIGLELDPQKLWRIRKLVAGLGLSQMLFTSLLFFLTAMAAGLQWQSALATGLALAMSSTAIVLQSLKEKGLMQTAAGQGSFAVLLFQDISVIPVLALLPLLVFLPSVPEASAGHSLTGDLPGWAQSFALLGAVAIVVTAGKYGVVPLLRVVAKTGLRELFTASSLLIVVGIAFLMELVGLSPALGTFLGGVVLANSEFRHELESDVEPFKGLLLGLFFMAVGASINFELIGGNPIMIILLTLGVMLLKAVVLFVTGRVSGLSFSQNMLFSVGMSQVGEFAFVLFSLTGSLRIISQEQLDIMMAVTALSMTLSPLLIKLNEKLVMKRAGSGTGKERQPDSIAEKNRVIIAGFSHFGSTVGRFLRANGVEATILDNNSDQVEFLRKMGFRVYYGDATRLDLLEAAGARDAKILITAFNDLERNLRLIETVRKHFPHLEIMVRTRNRYDAYELMDTGEKNIYREHLDTSVRLGIDVLKKLGHRAYSSLRAGQNFIRYDEESMQKLYSQRHDQKGYIDSAREQIALQEELLQNDLRQNPSSNDHAWDSEFMREAILARSGK
jgi:monovalent cation:H+ antiporter-2, CPA2 family